MTECIVAIKTDQPEAEIHIMCDGVTHSYTWTAHRQLAQQLLAALADQLKKAGCSITDITGLIFYKGPGSFTGLRIGASVVNALAYDKKLPISSQTGDSWIEAGQKALMAGRSEKLATLEYGGQIHITSPKK